MCVCTKSRAPYALFVSIYMYMNVRHYICCIVQYNYLAGFQCILLRSALGAVCMCCAHFWSLSHSLLLCSSQTHSFSLSRSLNKNNKLYTLLHTNTHAPSGGSSSKQQQPLLIFARLPTQPTTFTAQISCAHIYIFHFRIPSNIQFCVSLFLSSYSCICSDVCVIKTIQLRLFTKNAFDWN